MCSSTPLVIIHAKADCVASLNISKRKSEVVVDVKLYAWIFGQMELEYFKIVMMTNKKSLLVVGERA